MALAWRRLLIFVCAHSAKAWVAPERPSILITQPINNKKISMLTLQSLSWSSCQNKAMASFSKCCIEASGWNCSTNKTDKKMPKPKDSKTRRVVMRSEEHTSELQSRPHLVCRLLLEKKKPHKYI